MIATYLICTPLTLFLSLLLRVLHTSRRRRNLNLPPFPLPALPIIGHLHLLKQPLHRTFQNLSQKYGSIFSLQLGNRFVVVVSSSSSVEECFTKNDMVLANRPRFSVGQYIGYNWSTMSGSPYGNHWRNLRRLCALEIFSTTRLNVFTFVRKDEISCLLENLYKKSPAKVDLKSKFMELTINIIMRMVAGKRIFGAEVEDLEEAKKFRGVIEVAFMYAGASNPADFLPILRWINYKGIEKNLVKLSTETDALWQGLIDECRRGGKSRNTMIDHLLSLQESQPGYYNDQIIKGLIMNMLTAGTETQAVTMEWAMSLLLNHPEVLYKEVEVHKLMPFGMGRRACPGAGLAQRVVGLTLGSLIQCFEWDRVSDAEIDLTEGSGLSMPKAQALEAICRPRGIMHKLFAGDGKDGLDIFLREEIKEFS